MIRDDSAFPLIIELLTFRKTQTFLIRSQNYIQSDILKLSYMYLLTKKTNNLVTS